LKSHSKISENSKNLVSQFKEEQWATAASTDWKLFTVEEWHYVLEQTKSTSLSKFILSSMLVTLLNQYYQQNKVYRASR
jgi:hypothetical protein